MTPEQSRAILLTLADPTLLARLTPLAMLACRWYAEAAQTTGGYGPGMRQCAEDLEAHIMREAVFAP